MSVLGDVFGSLRTMSQLQLLLAFMAFATYALAQGALVSAKARRYAAGTALLCVTVFAAESTQWMYAAMLVTFAIAGLGVFIGLAWITSRLLGLAEPRTANDLAELAELADAADAEVIVSAPQPALLVLSPPGGASSA